jgi:sugar diacid utilization regulator
MAQSTDGERETLTLGRLLQERLLRAAAPAVAETDLDRPVSTCLPWAEATRSTGPLDGAIVFAHADEVDAAGVRAVADTGAAALVVAGAAPETDVALPVLGADDRVAYRDLNRLVAELSLARETHVLRYGLTVHRSLVELLYRGAGLPALCHQMARLSGGGVAILDPQYRVLAFEQSRDRVFEPGAVAGALRAETASIPIEPSQTHAHPSVHVLHVEDAPVTCVANPILLGGRHDGWVVVIESADPPHPHDVAEHRVVVEQSATIVGTEMLRMRSVEQAEERARGDFVHALLHGRFATAHDLEARATHYGFPVEGSYGVIVAGSLGASGATESLTALFQLARDATRLAPRPDSHTLATVVGDVLAVIRPVEPGRRGASPDAAGRELADYARVLAQELARRVHRDIPVAFGRAVSGAARIFDSYREARLALGLRKRLDIDQVCGFQDLRVYATLVDLAGSEGGQAFARDILGPLRGQRSGSGDLETAVLTYIQSGGNLNAAARELHVHRNTMLYKLDRASRALQLDLRDAEHQFTVWLAHKLDLLAETATAVDRDVRPS